MAKRNSVSFLFNVTNDLERSFQCPIIFITETDLADPIYNSLINMVEIRQEKPEKLLEAIQNFHYEWLEAVKNIENIKNNVKEIPREVILRAIDFTIKCIENRYAYVSKYIEEMQSDLKYDEQQLMEAHKDIISELLQIHRNALLEKQNIFKQADQKTYIKQVYNEIEELLLWLDRQYDHLAIQYSRVLDLNESMTPRDLTKNLKEIFEEITAASDPHYQKNAGVKINLNNKTTQKLPTSSLKELEIARLIIKIKVLEDRISKLEHENSPALMALENRATYLKGKVESLLNIGQKMTGLETETSFDDEIMEECIFSHILLPQDRLQLVERLVTLWENAVRIKSHESIISILSVADFKEVYSDAIGQFTVDKYGRKIYSKNNELYQLNEKNALVIVRDDEKHPYFYDDCGRYYLNAKRERVYKAHDNASEYLLNNTGMLFKIKEIINGTEYFYDCLGRYYINKDGRHIYQGQSGSSKYEHDGLGNLVKITRTKYYHDPYVCKPFSTEENQYLQQEVGLALKKCIAHVILHRPTDPIAYLADCLVKYKFNILDSHSSLEAEKERLENGLLYRTINNLPSPNAFEYNYERVYGVQEGEEY